MYINMNKLQYYMFCLIFYSLLTFIFDMRISFIYFPILMLAITRTIFELNLMYF